MLTVKRPILFLLCAIPALLCMTAIFRFSAQPAAISSDTSGGFIRQVLTALMPNFEELPSEEQTAKIQSLQKVVRKGAHLTIYAVLGVLCVPPAFIFRRRLRSSLLWSFGATALFAASDEIHQYFVPGRSCEVRDVFIDCVGAALGLLLLRGFVFLIDKRKCSLIQKNKT